MEKITALENLKKGWEEYQTFCLDFVQTFEEKHPGYGPNKDCWTTTELKSFADTDFEPQIASLQTSVNCAYDTTQWLKIAGYSKEEMLQLIFKIAKQPHAFTADKQELIQGIISAFDAVLKVPARAEVEALIKNLLVWQNEQSEFTTGIDPDEDRILTPVDKLRLARLADQAKLFLQNSPSHKNVFQDFITAYSKNNIPAMLGTVTKLLDALCEIRNTLPNSGTAGDKKNGGQSIDSQNKQEDIIELKPNFCGIGLNLNALIRKIMLRLKK